MLLLILGCAPGFLRSHEGREPIRSAFYATDANSDSALVLLSNSYVSCDLPETDDADEMELALVQQSAALYREGASLLLFELLVGEDALPGTYRLNDGSDDPDEDVPETRGFNAAWWHVNEAVVEARDGLIVSYSPGTSAGDFEFLPFVPSPGEVVITDADDRLKGEFAIDSLDLSGRFEAEPCEINSYLYTNLAFGL